MKALIVGTGLLLSSSSALAADPVDSTKPAPAPPAAPSAPSTPPSTSASAARTKDRLDLDTTTITGNRELPKVMYVVPWKRADLGDLAGRPANSLLDEVLSPVDRTVFRRQLSYFDEIDPDRAPQARAADAAEPAH